MPSSWATHYWQIWAGAFFVSFFGVEIYTLCTNWRNSLSANVWRALRASPQEPIGSWTALHFISAGVYIVIGVWLFGHFFFMRWRG